MAHPILLYCHKGPRLEETLVKDSFPLMICVGREANYEGDVANEIGAFQYGRCPMWNCARDFLGEVAGSRAALKSAIKRHGKSPVVHADVSPRCLRDREGKRESRRSLLPKDLKNHLRNLLSHEEIWSRARLVVFTGLSKDERTIPKSFIAARTALEKALRKKYPRLQFIDVPFFGRARSREFEGTTIKSFPLPDVKTLASIVRRLKKYEPQTREAKLILEGFLALEQPGTRLDGVYWNALPNGATCEYHMKDGLMDGLYREWNAKGELRYEKTFRKGHVLKFKHWKNGALIAEKDYDLREN